MASKPVIDSACEGNANALVGALASAEPAEPQAETQVAIGRPGRTLSIYPAAAGYDLQEELEFLTNRAIEPNVFFTARFLAPAMPRLEDRVIRLLVIRDEAGARSRLRLLMPFSLERPGFAVGPSILRVWSHEFGPVGTPLLDREDAAETLDNLLEGLSHPNLGLPPVVVIPDLPFDGPFCDMARAVAMARNLPVAEAARVMRPMLESSREGDAYIAKALPADRRQALEDRWRGLQETARLDYAVARQPAEIRRRFEEFLMLEAVGWKARQRSAMIADRYRAAFAREAVTNLAAADAVRIHTLDLDGRAIASMIVFVVSGEAYAWRIASDEAHAASSPEELLMMRVTEWHLDDPNILRTDSCAGQDDPLTSPFWRERVPFGTLVIGTEANRDREVRQVAARLHLYENTRNMARLVREKVRAIARARRQRS